MNVFSPTLSFAASTLVLAGSGDSYKFRRPAPFAQGCDDLYKDAGLDSSLVIAKETDLVPPKLELSDQYKQVERTLQEALKPILPSGRRAQIILGFPGRSKVDPLYALRYLDFAQAMTGRPGYLTVYDRDDHALTQSYYTDSLPLSLYRDEAMLKEGEHTLIPHWGSLEGAVQYVRPQLGHLAIVLMPGIHYSMIEPFLEKVLVRGGLALWMHDYGLSDPTPERTHSEMIEHLEEKYEFLQPPLNSLPIRTPFSARSPNGHTLLLRKRA